mmetsp:Transcript_35919/g.81066  ORF Transcript_35919/g.81066 Transcript_35919/m.81066 type:complete len:476 (+) Transcript_35919:109-1536(+)|eukprot:CAMPEP_0204363842 /NCGR_PEP_ID=MMETSP0469-20131031/40671_1 /ASSEMBLY_ACC=CAM_ASM_000384 /TAXON_ID=2969 /ORGANISM="Oxyrrhis marina" /LENGTH=475 /DNA_ID=CAMNT_0051352641 /DNA_START=74 /DNA_END=1504 /DNA_ORIENTATION=-
MTDVQSALDKIGMTWSHATLLAVCTGLVFLDGSEMLTVSSMVRVLQHEYDVSALDRSLMVSAVFVGVTIGGLLGGIAGDRYGRRPAVLSSYFFVGLFGTLCCLAPGLYSMIFMRFLLGISFGVGVPSGMALLVEFLPTNRRDAVNNIVFAFFPLGEMFAALGCMFFMPTLDKGDWRPLCVWAAVPAYILFPIALLTIRESPRWLQINRRFPEAQEALAWLGKEESPTEICTPREMQPLGSAGERLRRMFDPDLRATTLGFCYFCIIANFLYYGQSYAQAQTFGGIEGSMDFVSPAGQLLISCAFELPGSLVAAVLIQSPWGYSRSLQAVLAVTFILCIMLITVDYQLYAVFVPASYVMKGVSSSFFVFTYVVMATVFPTSVRNIALGFCVSVGRIGSISAPIIFELVGEIEQRKHALFFVLSAIAAAGGILVVPYVPCEMKGKPLNDTEAAAGECGGRGELIPLRKGVPEGSDTC